MNYQISLFSAINTTKNAMEKEIKESVKPLENDTPRKSVINMTETRKQELGIIGAQLSKLADQILEK